MPSTAYYLLKPGLFTTEPSNLVGTTGFEPATP